MRLDNEFVLPVAIDTAWTALLDVPRVAPCFPGATVTSVEGDDISGYARVKLGPVVLTYEGTARFIEIDQEAHRVVIDGSGSDRKGNGTAQARITAQLTRVSDQETRCTIETDLMITGRPAQFGRGLMVDVSNKIIGQFAANLSQTLTNPAPLPTAATGQPTHESASPQASAPAAEPLDLLSMGRSAALKRSMPYLAVGAAALIVIIILRRR